MESNKARVFFRGLPVFVFPSHFTAGPLTKDPLRSRNQSGNAIHRIITVNRYRPLTSGLSALAWTLNKQINQSQKSFILQESKMTKPHSIFQIIILLMVQNSCTRLRLVVYPHDLRCGFSTIQPQWVGSRWWILKRSHWGHRSRKQRKRWRWWRFGWRWMIGWSSDDLDENFGSPCMAPCFQNTGVLWRCCFMEHIGQIYFCCILGHDLIVILKIGLNWRRGGESPRILFWVITCILCLEYKDQEVSS